MHPFELNIVYEQSDFVVFAKPEGLGVHREDDQPGVHAMAEAQCGQKLWLVHRLDKVTSGLLLMAKNESSARMFGKLFSEKKVQKTYLALSFNRPKRKQGRIKGDMVSARRGSFKLTKSLNNPAVTDFFSISVAPGVRAIVCRPITGKTHQIRVALKSEGAPIVGDQRYGHSSDRTYLHAWRLSFVYNEQLFELEHNPISGEMFLLPEFEATLTRLNDIDLWPSHWRHSLEDIDE